MEIEVLGGRIDIDEGHLAAPPEAVRRQVSQYAAGDRRAFDCSVGFPDSYTGHVMRAMAAIPYGVTRTYGELADVLDSAPRAIGGACGRNPVPVVIPCHRVVRSDGGLGGYSAAGGVDLKRRLFAHERRHS